MNRPLAALFLVTMFGFAPLSGCFGEASTEEVEAVLTPGIDMPTTATRGQYMTLNFESTVDWTVTRSPGVFFQDEAGVLRDEMSVTLPPTTTSVTVLVLDTERESVSFNVSAGDQSWNATMMLEESSDLMLVDGRRAYQTIDMLTSSYNNRWCASASIHEGGAAYEAAAEVMAEEMRGFGFDFVEVTRYEDDPDQLNVVG